ncbi:fos-related antigen 2-like isoform X2 [Cimex lectularius]|nr:fos-related antigen 2-like isoform X2 [Cimex lectularius]
MEEDLQAWLESLFQPDVKPVQVKRRRKSENLTSEERLKLSIRRERNRMAAARCRQRKDEWIEELQRQEDELQREKNEFLSEIRSLTEQKDRFSAMLASHNCNTGEQTFPFCPPLEFPVPQIKFNFNSLMEGGTGLTPDTPDEKVILTLK